MHWEPAIWQLQLRLQWGQAHLIESTGQVVTRPQRNWLHVEQLPTFIPASVGKEFLLVTQLCGGGNQGTGTIPRCRWKRRLPFLVRRKWRGWPMRGRRIGEASKPGPAGSAAMDVDSRGQTRAGSPTGLPAAHRSRIEEQQRVYCPVIGCPASQPASAHGWGSHEAMRAHLDDHAAGSLAGDIPVDHLASQRLQLCGVCGLLVAQRFNGVHPRCRPATRGCCGAWAPS